MKKQRFGVEPTQFKIREFKHWMTHEPVIHLVVSRLVNDVRCSLVLSHSKNKQCVFAYIGDWHSKAGVLDGCLTCYVNSKHITDADWKWHQSVSIFESDEPAFYDLAIRADDMIFIYEGFHDDKIFIYEGFHVVFNFMDSGGQTALSAFVEKTGRSV